MRTPKGENLVKYFKSKLNVLYREINKWSPKEKEELVNEIWRLYRSAAKDPPGYKEEER